MNVFDMQLNSVEKERIERLGSRPSYSKVSFVFKNELKWYGGKGADYAKRMCTLIFTNKKTSHLRKDLKLNGWVQGENMTPLQLAIYYKNFPVIWHLLKNLKADVSRHNIHGENAIQTAKRILPKCVSIIRFMEKLLLLKNKSTPPEKKFVEKEFKPSFNKTFIPSWSTPASEVLQRLGLGAYSLQNE